MRHGLPTVNGHLSEDHGGFHRNVYKVLVLFPLGEDGEAIS